jgi:hypothetical protein
MRFARLIRITAILLVAALLSNSVAFAAKKPLGPAELKVKIQGRGVGRGVRVVLADKTQVVGMIVSVGDQSFVLKPRKKNSQPVEIEFVQLTDVREDRLSRGQKVTIAVVAVSAAVAVVGIVIAIKVDHIWGPI